VRRRPLRWSSCRAFYPVLCTPRLCSGFMLQGYLRTGRSSMIDSTRVMLAKHKQGHLVTIQLRIRDLPAVEAGQGALTGQADGFVLMGLVRLMDSRSDGAPQEETLLATGDGKLTSGTLGALRMLGASPDELASGVLTFDDSECCDAWSTFPLFLVQPSYHAFTHPPLRPVLQSSRRGTPLKAMSCHRRVPSSRSCLCMETLSTATARQRAAPCGKPCHRGATTLRSSMKCSAMTARRTRPPHSWLVSR